MRDRVSSATDRPAFAAAETSRFFKKMGIRKVTLPLFNLAMQAS
jgi:hypothetical protein